MKDDIRQYAKIGLVHHMLYPECVGDPDIHEKTLLDFMDRKDIEAFDCCLPFGEERRARLEKKILSRNLDACYAMHLFPMRKISFGSTAYAEQELAKMVVKDQIACAARIKSTGFILASGADVPEGERPASCRAFKEFLTWFAKELRPHGIDALLEPFDRTIDKKFLYGPTSECMELLNSVLPEADNIGIELDMAHLPLMGEDFESAVKTVAPLLKRVHLGNCVLKHPKSIWYGDNHPPMGYSEGENDIPELTRFLKAILDAGFLSKAKRGVVLIEMKPFPGKTAEETVQDQWSRLETAWENV